MALESTTYISGLVVTNPTSSDNISDGDNHIRLLKSTIKATFPNIAGVVTGTSTQINDAVSLSNSATHSSTNNTLVRRDGSGNFSAGTITAALTGNVTGNVSGSAGTASTAGRWTTARTISLTGDVSGSASIRGDANASISVTVADDSHNHTIANVDGLTAALSGKVDDGQVLTNVPSGALFTDNNTTYTAGSGLTLSGTTFSNAAPDRTVTLTGSGATSVSGSYPNFTISSTDTNTNTTYSVGNGGLTQINFTSALNSKLAGIEAGATADQTAAEIVALAAGCAAGTVDGFSISTSQSGSAANTIYFRT